jgi:sigma-B regulation protein RsbU (phosphoserine phosphatase)
VRTDRAWLLVALAVDTGIAAANLTAGLLSGFLISGPLLASARLSAARTGLVAVYGVALAIVLPVPDEAFASRQHLLVCLVVATGGAFATLTARIRCEREAALLRMTHVAEVAQRAILRPIPARIGGVSFATRYQSASEEALIGGDLYDAAVTPFGLRTIVGDVKGKGLEAVTLAAAVLSHFREAAFAEPDLVWVAAELEAQLAAELRAEDFVTVVLAEYLPGEVRLVNCGHQPPVRVGDALETLHPAQPVPPLGLRPRPTVQRVRVAPGERLLFYTDGLVEARNSDGEMFALDERARECLAEPSLDDALSRLLEAVLAHTGGRLDDDLALVLSEALPDQSAGLVELASDPRHRPRSHEEPTPVAERQD